MGQVNKYYRRTKISEAKFRHLVRCFSLDLTATNTAALTGLSLRSIHDIFFRIRTRLAEACQRESVASPEDVEVDESYFGPRRVRGKPGRGAGGKTIVFGIYERGGQVYTEIVPDCRKRTLQAVVRGRIPLETAIHSDGWSGYDGLVDVGYEKHFRVKHREGTFSSGRTHINGIEAFWSFAKRRLQKFNGIPDHTFELHLKECEWRFNHRKDDLYQALLKLLRTRPL